ncbi:MAG: hypothetical protein ILO53_05640 [Clostridia bacterium]|nr:hypothetical protein [Clostridia bacterium]
MSRSNIDEYMFDPGLEDLPLPAEFGAYGSGAEYGNAAAEDVAAPEDVIPLEFPVAPAEFGEGKDRSSFTEGGSRGSRRSVIKKIMFATIASVIAGVVIIYASFNVDPLGSDFLLKGLFPPASGPVTPVTPGSATSFPKLPNLNPDYAGTCAWSGLGSEEYILVDNTTYIAAGTTFTGAFGLPVGTVPGASYNSATNTLTLTNYSGSSIEVNLMGNGFTIELVGGNSLDKITVYGSTYGGSVTFTGSGTLVLNKSGKESSGLFLQCESSPSCVMIDKGVTLDVYGTEAIMVVGTTLDQGIYTLDPIQITGGTGQSVTVTEVRTLVLDKNGNYLADEYGNRAAVAATADDIRKQLGVVDYYDFSVADETGKPSQHVIFAPAASSP